MFYWLIIVGYCNFNVLVEFFFKFYEVFGKVFGFFDSFYFNIFFSWDVNENVLIVYSVFF